MFESLIHNQIGNRKLGLKQAHSFLIPVPLDIRGTEISEYVIDGGFHLTFLFLFGTKMGWRLCKVPPLIAQDWMHYGI